MTFTQSISSGFRRYFDLRTRSSRSEYWWWTLFSVLIGVTAVVLDELLFGGRAVLDTVSTLTLLAPGLSVAVRRLHDVDRSGWWILIAFTIIGAIYPLLYWSIKPGTRGTNRFGPDPVLSPANGYPEDAGGLMVSATTQGFCSNCGSQLEPDANFCPSCGTAI